MDWFYLNPLCPTLGMFLLMAGSYLFGFYSQMKKWVEKIVGFLVGVAIFLFGILLVERFVTLTIVVYALIDSSDQMVGEYYAVFTILVSAAVGMWIGVNHGIKFVAEQEIWRLEQEKYLPKQKGRKIY